MTIVLTNDKIRRSSESTIKIAYTVRLYGTTKGGNIGCDKYDNVYITLKNIDGTWQPVDSNNISMETPCYSANLPYFVSGTLQSVTVE